MSWKNPLLQQAFTGPGEISDDSFDTLLAHEEKR